MLPTAGDQLEYAALLWLTERFRWQASVLFTVQRGGEPPETCSQAAGAYPFVALPGPWEMSDYSPQASVGTTFSRVMSSCATQLFNFQWLARPATRSLFLLFTYSSHR